MEPLSTNMNKSWWNQLLSHLNTVTRPRPGGQTQLPWKRPILRRGRKACSDHDTSCVKLLKLNGNSDELQLVKPSFIVLISGCSSCSSVGVTWFTAAAKQAASVTRKFQQKLIKRSIMKVTYQSLLNGRSLKALLVKCKPALFCELCRVWLMQWSGCPVSCLIKWDAGLLSFKCGSMAEMKV